MAPFAVRVTVSLNRFFLGSRASLVLFDCREPIFGSINYKILNSNERRKLLGPFNDNTFNGSVSGHKARDPQENCL